MATVSLQRTVLLLGSWGGQRGWPGASGISQAHGIFQTTPGKDKDRPPSLRPVEGAPGGPEQTRQLSFPVPPPPSCFSVD